MPSKKTARLKVPTGFTIVEILIVLGIVGLIMMIVFLAVPALQRNSRNHQRQQDTTKLLSLIQEYYSQRGVYPDSCNNTRGSCFLRDIDLLYYDNESLSSNNVSFYHRTTPYNPADDPQLNPNDPHSKERITIRLFTKCLPNGDMTGVGAQRYNLVAQYIYETTNGGVRTCFEAS